MSTPEGRSGHDCTQRYVTLSNLDKAKCHYPHNVYANCYMRMAVEDGDITWWDYILYRLRFWQKDHH